MPWQFLLIVSVATRSLSVLLQRTLLHDYKLDPYAYAIVFQSLVAIFLSINALFAGFELPDIASFWPQILLTFIAFGVGNILYAKSLQRTEASVFTVLFATYSIWVMLTSYFLYGDRLTGTQVLGALLVFAGIALLIEKKGKIKFDKGTALSLATGLCYGIAATVWIWVSKTADINTWNAMSFAGPALVILMIKPRALAKVKEILRPEALVRISVLGLLFSISVTALLNAFNRGQASIVAPLQQTEIILTVILAMIFLKERENIPRRLLAGLVCFSGVILLAM